MTIVAKIVEVVCRLPSGMSVACDMSTNGNWAVVCQLECSGINDWFQRITG